MKPSTVLLSLPLVASVDASPFGQRNAQPNFRWTDLPPVGNGAPIQEHGTTATDTHIYLLGGISPNANASIPAIQSRDTFEAYSLEDGTWERLPPIPEAFTHINAAAIGGKVYVLGGLTGDGADRVWRSTRDSFVYDIASRVWSDLPPMPEGQGRGSAAIGISGDIIYLAGGLDRLEIGGEQLTLDIVTAYDTKKGTWTTLPSLPAPRDHVGGAIIGSKFWVVGGRDHGQVNVRNTTWSLDLKAPEKGWKAHAEMPTARGGLAFGVIGDYIATFGGEGNPDPASNGVFNETEVYSIKEDKWFKQPAMPHPRHGTAAASVNGRIYIPGGGIVLGSGPVDTFDTFGLSP
ncbi:galactose oxidase [Daldinia eschscholtzii]|nr:galactose oxidase [Daldinia eschscholtzii]